MKINPENLEYGIPKNKSLIMINGIPKVMKKGKSFICKNIKQHEKWRWGKLDSYWRTSRAYIRTIEDGKRKWVPIGFYCEACMTFYSPEKTLLEIFSILFNLV